MVGGTYSLLLWLDDCTSLTVGALGERRFDRGGYVYTGSALGPGGFARDRHCRIASGQQHTRHWHIDSLLGVAELDAVYTDVGSAIECAVARSLPGGRVSGFGVSDCDCDSHLAYAPDVATLSLALRSRYGPACGDNVTRS